jgi:hypothetical protein
MHPSVPAGALCVRGGGWRRCPTGTPSRGPGSPAHARPPRSRSLPTTSKTLLAGPLWALGPRAGDTTPTMEDRERLQWHPAARARRERATAWGITLLHTLPLIVACLLALLLGRPEISAATLGLAMLTLGLVRTLTRPRKLAMARLKPGLREVRRSH